MIGGLDSSFARPNAAQAAAAYAAGIRVWGGYLGTRGGLGLATLWDQAAFQIVKAAGMTAIGFCSGWEDPVAIRALATAWGVLPCVDVETGIRTDGLWLDDWLPIAGAGLYGLASVHYEVGQPIGRRAAFNIVADYLTIGCTGEIWPSWLQRPSGPCGWQCQGSHFEFGLDVDRGWYDDWFATGGLPLDQATFDKLMNDWLASQGNMSLVDLDALRWRVEALLENRAAVTGGPTAGEVNQLKARLDSLTGGSALTPTQVQLLQEAHDAVLRLEAALKNA